jgi:hypothetical protein
VSERHLASQAGTWCGTGWDVPREGDIADVDCTPCLVRYSAHLESEAARVRKRLFDVGKLAYERRLAETPPTRCQAGRDGECRWSGCPQERDGGKHRQKRCPLWVDEEDT